MELLEKNHEWISDGTYLAFKQFIEFIVPEYFDRGLKQNLKTLYIPISNREDGVYVGNHYLGKIFYPEFITYIYHLPSYKGFKLPNPANVINDFLVPFDFWQLINDYFEELQREDYPIYNQNNRVIEDYNLQELTDLAWVNFEKNILKDVITNSFAGLYDMMEILDVDGTTVISRTVNLNIEIVNDNLVLAGFNIGRVDIERFLNYLTNLPCYIGKSVNDSLINGEVKFTFDLEGLVNYYYSKNFSR